MKVQDIQQQLAKYQKNYLSLPPTNHENPKHLTLESTTDAYDTLSSDDLRIRNELIASQPWFGARDDDKADISRDIVTEGALHNLMESGLIDDIANGSNTTTNRITDRLIQVTAREIVVDENFDSDTGELEYASEDVCEAMKKDVKREISNSMHLLAEDSGVSGKWNNITFDHKLQVSEESADLKLGEANIEMVSILSNHTVQVVDHTVIRHRLEFLNLESVSDLTSAIVRGSIVVPSLPVSIVTFLSGLAHRFVEVHDAKGKRLQLPVSCTFVASLIW